VIVCAFPAALSGRRSTLRNRGRSADREANCNTPSAATSDGLEARWLPSFSSASSPTSKRTSSSVACSNGGPAFERYPVYFRSSTAATKRRAMYAGYFFDSAEALAAFRETELAQTIPQAYEAVEVRRETYDLLYPLWPERGPFCDINRTAATPR
jgi:hypothetical protein